MSSQDIEPVNQSAHSFEDEESDFREFENVKPVDDKPCVTSCCLCCNLGLGTILAAVIFLVSFFRYQSV